MGQSIQEWTKGNLLKTAFKKFEVIWSAEAYIFNHLAAYAALMSSPNMHFFTHIQKCFHLNVINKGILTEVNCSGICHY